MSESIDTFVDEVAPDAAILLADGFEDAFIGVGSRFNTNMAVYDRDKCISILIERDGMSAEEAEEFFEFNVSGSYVGEATPVFVVRK